MDGLLEALRKLAEQLEVNSETGITSGPSPPPPPVPDPSSHLAQILTGHTSEISGVAFSPDGRLLATASQDWSARLWDPTTGDCLRTLTVPMQVVRGVAYPPDTGMGPVDGVAFSPDGRMLATAGLTQGVRLWDPATGACLRALHLYGPVGVAFSPDGRMLATAGIGALLLDPATGALLHSPKRHTSKLRAVRALFIPARIGRQGVAFSPDGRLVATADGGANTARLWDPATGACLRTLIGHTGKYGVVWGVAFSPDGRLLATASSDNTARLWEPATGACPRVLTGHTKSVKAVAFSPDGRLLATASSDNTARLWDPATGVCLGILTGHTAAVSGVAFSPDGRLLATASDDNTARVWH